jgi:hypothetical protein
VYNILVKPDGLIFPAMGGRVMRMLMKVSFPNEAFNAAIKDGSVGPTIGRILGEIKPEAAYFTEMSGRRTAILIVDLAEPSKVPALAEPWFLKFGAEVETRIVMTPDDLGKAGLEALGKKWS